MNKKTQLLVEGAMLIAMAYVLSMIKLYELPQGGSITLEMLPLVVMGLRNGTKWGCFTGLVHGLLQMIIGMSNVMYCQTIAAMIGCILLDYLLAFTVLGLAPLFAKVTKNRAAGFVIGTVIVCLLRYLCSFLSGWLIWSAYAPEGMSASYYSLVYNGSYMIPDTIITAIVVFALYKVAPKMFRNN